MIGQPALLNHSRPCAWWIGWGRSRTRSSGWREGKIEVVLLVLPFQSMYVGDGGGDMGQGGVNNIHTSEYIRTTLHFHKPNVT